MSRLNPTHQFISINGQVVRYIEAGEGRQVIVLHQLAVYGSADHWRPYLDTLTTAGRIYALDLPGWGLSEPPAGGVSFENWVETIKGFCDAKKLAVVDVLAMSIGAWIGALFAHQNPDRVRRLALLDCPGLNKFNAYRYEDFQLPTREDIRNIHVYDQQVADLVYDNMNQPGRREGYIALLKVVADPAIREKWSLRPRLPEMPMPMLFTNYDTDVAIPVESTLEAFQLAPVSRLFITATGFGAKALDIYGDHVDAGVEFLKKETIVPARART